MQLRIKENNSLLNNFRPQSLRGGGLFDFGNFNNQNNRGRSINFGNFASGSNYPGNNRFNKFNIFNQNLASRGLGNSQTQLRSRVRDMFGCMVYLMEDSP